ncbi:MAG: hypothetical protein K2H64_10000 [Desulfovibrio sp.]|nr:hypothetical protein [Desulfovibrio sp.]
MSQPENRPTLIEGLQNEVSPESAPLLRFITKHASAIAGVVLSLLLILGGMAVWNWYHGGKQKEAREELARINAQLKGKDKDAALLKLAENAPDSAKLFIYLSLGQSAQENGDPILAADAYAKAAKIDGDGPLGLTAALGSVMSLLMQGEAEQAYALLQELKTKLPAASQTTDFKQLLAEAASSSFRKEEAAKIYYELAKETKDSHLANMYEYRAEQLERSAKKKAAE